jgi:hypothetical protein
MSWKQTVKNMEKAAAYVLEHPQDWHTASSLADAVNAPQTDVEHIARRLHGMYLRGEIKRRRREKRTIVEYQAKERSSDGIPGSGADTGARADERGRKENRDRLSA